MSVDAKPFSLQPEIKRQLELLELDNSLKSLHKHNQVITRELQNEYIYGGVGNRRLAALVENRIEDKTKEDKLKQNEVDLMKKIWEGLSYEKPLFDYRVDNKDYPKEWDNIQWGRDTWKINKKEWRIIWTVIGSVVGMVGFLLSLIF